MRVGGLPLSVWHGGTYVVRWVFRINLGLIFLSSSSFSGLFSIMITYIRTQPYCILSRLCSYDSQAFVRSHIESSSIVAIQSPVHSFSSCGDMYIHIQMSIALLIIIIILCVVLVCWIYGEKDSWQDEVRRAAESENWKFIQ